MDGVDWYTGYTIYLTTLFYSIHLQQSHPVHNLGFIAFRDDCFGAMAVVLKIQPENNVDYFRAGVLDLTVSQCNQLADYSPTARYFFFALAGLHV